MLDKGGVGVVEKVKVNLDRNSRCFNIVLYSIYPRCSESQIRTRGVGGPGDLIVKYSKSTVDEALGSPS